MAKFVGRNVVVKRNGVTIGALRTKSFTIGSEPIDITTDDDSGFRTLLEAAGKRQIDMSVEGLLTDTTLFDAAVDGSTAILSYVIQFPDLNTSIEGNFRFNNLQMGAPHEEAVTFSAEMQSSGEFTTAAI